MQMQLPVVGGASHRAQLPVPPGGGVLPVDAFFCLVAVTPSRRQAVVGPRVDQFHTAAAALGPARPVAVVAVIDLVGQVAVDVLEPQQLARVAQLPAIIPQHVAEFIHPFHVGGVGSDDEVAAGRDARAGRKREVHPVNEPPARQVDCLGVPVVKFDVLAATMVARRIEHHLVDDHVLVARRVVGAPLCVVGHCEPFTAPVRERLH